MNEKITTRPEPDKTNEVLRGGHRGVWWERVGDADGGALISKGGRYHSDILASVGVFVGENGSEEGDGATTYEGGMPDTCVFIGIWRWCNTSSLRRLVSPRPPLAVTRGRLRDWHREARAQPRGTWG